MRKQRITVNKHKINPFKINKNNYKKVELFTYLFKSQNIYKIGKSANVQKRYIQGLTFSPMLEIIKVYNGNYETALHNYFKDKRIKNSEWFTLSNEDIIQFDNIVSNLKDNVILRRITNDCIYIHRDILEYAMLHLSHTELKLWFYILLNLQENSDEIQLNFIDIRNTFSWANNTIFYEALRNLVAKDFLAKSWKGNTTYWINVDYFFNGNRKDLIWKNN